jgi:putative FmdB family regulatory protein
MPTYDYICDSCGHEFEIYESIMSKPRNDCPECKELTLRRKIGPGAAILFKGSGFYQTDYRSDSYKKAAQAEKTANEPAKPASESKNSSESKPASESKTTSESKPATEKGSAPRSEPAKTNTSSPSSKSES